MPTSKFFIICIVRFAIAFHAIQHSKTCDDTTADCAKKVSLCSNPLFEELMRSHCKRSYPSRTCGFCDSNEEEEYFEEIGGGGEEEEESYTEEPTSEETTDTAEEYPDPEEIDSNTESPEVSPHSGKPSESCIDLGHDCEEKIHLCHHWQYSSLMARICQRTCDLCDLEGERKPSLPTKPRSLASLLNCRDTASDCRKRIAYCHNPQYFNMMSKICKKSCSLC